MPAARDDATRLLRLAAALQAGSEHPLARAVLRRAREAAALAAGRGDVRALPGRGVAGEVEGRALRARQRAPDARSAASRPARSAARPARLEATGRTVSWLAEPRPEPRVLGLLAFGDAVKPGARGGGRRAAARAGMRDRAC